MRGWKYSSIILDFCTRLIWVVSFMPWPLFLRGNRPQYPLDRRLGGPQGQSGGSGEQKNLALSGIEPEPSNNTKLSRLHLISNVTFLFCIFRKFNSFCDCWICDKLCAIEIDISVLTHTATANVSRNQCTVWTSNRCSPQPADTRPLWSSISFILGLQWNLSCLMVGNTSLNRT
jgi:hypothetical protein